MFIFCLSCFCLVPGCNRKRTIDQIDLPVPLVNTSCGIPVNTADYFDFSISNLTRDYTPTPFNNTSLTLYFSSGNVSQGVRAVVAYDFDGDNVWDRIEYYPIFYTSSNGTVEMYDASTFIVNGTSYMPLRNGTVHVILFEAVVFQNKNVTFYTTNSVIQIPYGPVVASTTTTTVTNPNSTIVQPTSTGIITGVITQPNNGTTTIVHPSSTAKATSHNNNSSSKMTFPLWLILLLIAIGVVIICGLFFICLCFVLLKPSKKRKQEEAKWGQTWDQDTINTVEALKKEEFEPHETQDEESLVVSNERYVAYEEQIKNRKINYE